MRVRGSKSDYDNYPDSFSNKYDYYFVVPYRGVAFTATYLALKAINTEEQFSQSLVSFSLICLTVARRLYTV
jgi:hypothetical protein